MITTITALPTFLFFLEIYITKSMKIITCAYLGYLRVGATNIKNKIRYCLTRAY